MKDTGRGRTHNERTKSERTSGERTDLERTENERTDNERTYDERTEHACVDKGRAAADVGRTERELREALETLAGGVRAAPDAYRTARGEWLRRERRRRLVLTVLITVVFALATLIGLWVLNHAPADHGVIFSGAGQATALGEPTAGWR